MTSHKAKAGAGGQEAAFGRLSVAQLRRRRRTVARRFPDVAEVLAGSVQTQLRRCGKEGCRCAQGELHGPYRYLSIRLSGRTRMLYVPDWLAEQVDRGVTATAAVHAALAEISAINLELLARGELD